MKRRKTFLRNFKISCFISLGLSASVYAQSSSDLTLSQPTHQVASLGACTTGSLVEGSIGAIHKGSRHRFYCQSTGPTKGFLGPQASAEPVSLKDQPGVFPAPLMGAASVTFHFSCPNLQTPVTPLIVRPDGTVFQGLPLTPDHSSQTLVMAAPAQTDIYTLFVLGHQKSSAETHVKVDASISTQPQHQQTLQLKSFQSNDKDSHLISAEFVYTPSSF